MFYSRLFSYEVDTISVKKSKAKQDDRSSEFRTSDFETLFYETPNAQTGFLH